MLKSTTSILLLATLFSPLHPRSSTAGPAQSQNAVERPAPTAEARRQDDSHNISGKLSDSGGPIANAAVYLNHLKNKACVRLFESRQRPSEKALQKLKACVTDIGPIEPDSQGRYAFTDLSPGYYALVVSWHTDDKFKKPVLAFRKGEFVVSYFEGAQYNIVATSRVFYFSGAGDMVKDFDFTKGRITNEVVPD